MSLPVPRREEKQVDDLDLIWDNADEAKARFENHLRGNPYERIKPVQVEQAQQEHDALSRMGDFDSPKAVEANARNDIAKTEATYEVMKQMDEGVMEPHRAQAFYRGIWDRY